ncbi:flotillin-like protein FloA [Tautonia plasticadhaerens]|uniref:Flotillin-like protein FloA n=1 Tax=Tautonia plasticadhaerens TaxID=2527974 RepID=A0A518H8N4_9BACT|nr:flotillin-like protein FloA [Tautonia plasticadhaerens]QDV37194.1 SigmaW regulon antibacterial [Tautonia plasticadhaerens]
MFSPLLAQQPEGNSLFVLLVFLVLFISIISLFAFILFAKYFNLWIQSKTTNANIGLIELIGMTFRKVNPNIIVRSKIMAVQAGLTDREGVTRQNLEAHYLAGGNVPNVIRALIAAQRADIPLTYKRAAAIDLAGRNVLEAIQTSVNPKVIDCPDPAKGRQTVDAVAKDGIQLKAKARVTVRTNIDRLVGGATEETIIARVGEGIVTTIGSAESHKIVLENPDMISKRVLEKGLDAGTAFEILSIDIADIDVGDNIGARLQADQAEADMRVARAKAEERRAAAIASEQENLASVQQNRAKVVLAEAEVPLAISEAFRKGQLGISDYYSLRNLQADTEMRSSIAGGTSNARRNIDSVNG